MVIIGEDEVFDSETNNRVFISDRTVYFTNPYIRENRQTGRIKIMGLTAGDNAKEILKQYANKMDSARVVK